MDKQSTPTSEVLLTPEELVARWRITKKHLARLHRAGLPRFKMSAHVTRYDPAAAEQWLRSREQQEAH